MTYTHLHLARRQGDGELYPETELTIVDAAEDWLAAYAAQHPALAAALADGALQMRAARTTLLWRRACAQRVSELRRSKGLRSQLGLSQLHRTLTNIMSAFVTQHSTFSTFLSEPLDALQRWQRACACGCGLSVSAVLTHPAPAFSLGDPHHGGALPAARQQCVNCCKLHARCGCALVPCPSPLTCVFPLQYGCSTPRESTAAPTCARC
jgi:hypothetical protein